MEYQNTIQGLKTHQKAISTIISNIIQIDANVSKTLFCLGKHTIQTNH